MWHGGKENCIGLNWKRIKNLSLRILRLRCWDNIKIRFNTMGCKDVKSILPAVDIEKLRAAVNIVRSFLFQKIR